MFLGRERELGELEKMYAQPGFQMVVLYGRRRVGKTTLLLEFCKDKDSIFLPMIRKNASINLFKFSDAVRQHFHEPNMAPFQSWNDALSWVDDHQGEKKLVLVIDEFPYLVRAAPELPSEFQHTIDHQLQHGNLFLILCGSYMSFMEKEVLGYGSPLYGRRSCGMKLEPLRFQDARSFIPTFSPVEQVQLYGALGGTPFYLKLVQPGVSVAENLQRIFLGLASPLSQEPLDDYSEEIRAPEVYSTLIEAIAGGATKPSELSTRISEDIQKCVKYLHVLCNLGIIKKEAPYGEKDNSKRAIYLISDQMACFWYTYVSRYQVSLMQFGASYVWNVLIEPDLNRYLGHVFEGICQDFLVQEIVSGRIPILAEKVGRWWGSDPATKEQVEIDIIAGNRRGEFVFTECKWRNQPMDVGDLKSLSQKADAFLRNRKETWLALMSRGGFTTGLQALAAADSHILLYDLDQILSGKPAS